jgi:hypothetical protein
MHTGWFIGQVALSVAVAVSILLSIGASREASKNRAAQEDANGWPLSAYPGDSIANLWAPNTPSVPLSTGFYVILNDETMLTAYLSSINLLCRCFGTDYRVLIRSPRPESTLLDDFRISFEVPFQQNTTSAKRALIIYVENSRIVDAAVDLYAPLALRRRFAFLPSVTPQPESTPMSQEEEVHERVGCSQ